MNKFFFLFVTLICTCVTSEKTAHFRQFPKHFHALQILDIHAKGENHKILANLERNSSAFYSIVFIHPLFQAPLLSLKFAQNRTTVKKLYDKLPNNIPSEKILDAIRQLYDAGSFEFFGDSTTENARFTTDLIEYTLTDFQNFAPNETCIFPRFISLHAKDNSVVGNIRIESKEVTCL